MKTSSEPSGRAVRNASRRLSRLGIAVVFVVLAAPSPVAGAYIDPISGSILIQILSAGILAAVVSIKRARDWFFSLFRRRKKPTGADVE